LRRLLVEDVPHADGELEVLAEFLRDRRIVIPRRGHFHVNANVASKRNSRRVAVDVGIEIVDAQAAAVIVPELLLVARSAENLASPEERPATRRSPGQSEVSNKSSRARAGLAKSVDDPEEIHGLVRKQGELLLERPAHVREQAQLASAGDIVLDEAGHVDAL